MKNVIEHTHISRSLVFEMEYLHTPTHTKKYSFMFLILTMMIYLRYSKFKHFWNYNYKFWKFQTKRARI